MIERWKRFAAVIIAGVMIFAAAAGAAASETAVDFESEITEVISEETAEEAVSNEESETVAAGEEAETTAAGEEAETTVAEEETETAVVEEDSEDAAQDEAETAVAEEESEATSDENKETAEEGVAEISDDSAVIQDENTETDETAAKDSNPESDITSSDPLDGSENMSSDVEETTDSLTDEGEEEGIILIITDEIEETSEEIIELFEDSCEHESAVYETVEPTLFTKGQKGGTYCTKCGKELTAPTEIPMLNLSSLLKEGVSGDEVYAVQEKLNELGYLAVSPDGSYGSYTKAAVNIFQTENGLDNPDGMVGNWTMGKLRSDAVSFFELEKGMNSPAVLLLQKALKDQGYLDVEPDGIFGNITYNALCKYQLNNNLSITGKADITTFTMLLRESGNAFRTLKYGMSGSDVSAVKTVLKNLGFYNGTVSQYYDESTEVAAFIFQSYYGLENPDGEVGNWTYGKLIDASDSFQVLNKGSKGTAVLVMQKYLSSGNYLSATPDGVFGNLTETALKLFQTANSIEATGTADYKTLSKLYGGDSVTTFRVLKYNDSGDDVKAVQEKLYKLGYLTSWPDGDFGKMTLGAVCAFQAANGLVYPDGQVGSWTIKMLNSNPSAFKAVDSSSSRAEILGIQRSLVSYGLLSSVTGEYDDNTIAAVKRIQLSNGLDQTGVCDQKTLYQIYFLGFYGGNMKSAQYYVSSTKWLIYINTTSNRMWVFNGSYGNWKLIYDWPCTTGAPSTPTVLGQFTTSSLRGYSFGGQTYTCYYYTSFYGPYYIHSEKYWKNTFDFQDSRLGMNLSMGCVRVALENAKWIYYNIPVGTKVVVVK